MSFLDRTMQYIAQLYVVCAFGALISVFVIGIWPTPLEKLADSDWAAGILRSLLALPMPLALALSCRCDWHRGLMWCVALLSGCILVVKGPLIITAILGLVISLAFKSTLTPIANSRDEFPDKMVVVTAIAILILTAGLRLLVLNEPFERDLMVYAMVARSWLEGMNLYAEAWDHKPPALYMAYAAAIALFGQQPIAIWSLGVVAFGVTLMGVKTAAASLGGGRAGVIAMLVWFVFGNDLLLQANQPNVEVFMNACLIWTFVFLLRVANNRDQSWDIVLAGAMVFFASAFKQIAVLYGFLAALWLIWLHLSLSRDLRTGIGSAARSIVLFSLPGLLGWLAIFLAFYAAGTFDAFYYAAFGYNQSYAGSVFWNLVETIFQDTRHPYYVALFFVLFFLHWRFETERTLLTLILLTFLGSALMVAAPGRGFPHYYQLLLPIMAVSSGALLNRFVPRQKVFVACLIALAPIWISFGYFTAAERAAFVKYGEAYHGGEALESRKIGTWISENTPPETIIFHWGAEPGVYFWSSRPTVYSYSYNYPLITGPRAEAMSQDMREQLECNPPDIVVLNRNMMDSEYREHLVFEFIFKNYEPLAGVPSYDFFEIWAGNVEAADCSKDVKVE